MAKRRRRRRRRKRRRRKRGRIIGFEGTKKIRLTEKIGEEEKRKNLRVIITSSKFDFLL